MTRLIKARAQHTVLFSFMSNSNSQLEIQFIILTTPGLNATVSDSVRMKFVAIVNKALIHACSHVIYNAKNHECSNKNWIMLAAWPAWPAWCV